MRRIQNVFIAAIIVAALGSTVIAQENYSQWSYFRNLALNTKASGANVATTVTNFPVLIRLTAADSAVFSTALANGADVRFAKANGTHLKYQIEQWNSTAKTAAIWVLVDTVKGNDSLAALKMFWGKAGAVDSSKGSAVFDTANGFRAVWHLNEATGATNSDATINAFSGTPTAMTDAAGIIGSGKVFDGTTSYMNTVATASGKLAFPAKSIYTLSVWFNADTTNGNYVISKGQIAYSLYFRTTSPFALSICETDNSVRENVEYTSVGMSHRWVFAAGTRNGTAASLYVDGALVSSTIVTSSSATPRSDTCTVQLGRRADGAKAYFDGIMDEVQIANVVRSADWIKLSYESQKVAASLVNLGTVQQQQATVGEDYATWSNSTPILLNTKASGANVATTVTKFPVLVRLNSSNSAIFTAAQTNGQDIRFAKLDGTHLKYQIEQWNSTAKTAAIWVLVDTIKGNDSASYFKMYYGKTGVADSSKGSVVFDTANGFQAVLHLSEATGTNNDATINAYNGTPNGTIDSTGIIGSAKYFNGTTSYIDLVGTATGKLNFDANGIYTVSVWGYAQDTTNTYYVSKGDGHYSLYHRTAGALAFVETNTIRELVQTSSTGIPTKWSYIVGIRNNTAMALYVDGALVSTTIVTGTTTGGRNTANSVQIGRMSGSTNYFTGKIDEVQIANVARSADWIKLCYQNQKESQVLVSVGSGAPPVVVVPVVPVLSAPANVATSITVSPTLSWGTVSGAVTYGVQLSTTSAFTSTVVNDSTLAAGTKAVSGLLNSSQYFWRVNAKNSAGTSAWSPVWSFTTSATTAYKTKYAFIYVVDGSRFVETFGDTIGAGVGTVSHSNIPYLWNQLRPLGTLYTKCYCGGNNNTETCPGHASIMTGTWQAIVNDGTERPHKPTLFEYYRKQTNAPQNDCFYIGGKTKLAILQYSDSVGYGSAYGANALYPAADRQYRDSTTFTNIKTVMNTYHPKLSIINMAQTDSTGHAGSGNSELTNASFSRYLGSIKQADSIAFKLWAAIQADSVYKNKTTLIITNDHGRHTTSATAWTSHGDQCDGCKHIMLLVIGPDTRQNIVDSTTVQQIDIAPTIGKLMGINLPYAAGSVLQSAVVVPSTNLSYQSGAVQNTGAYGISKIMCKNSQATIQFSVPVSGAVALKLFDLAGRECATIIHENVQAGSHTAIANMSSVASGAYVVRLTGTFGSVSQKMIVGR